MGDSALTPAVHPVRTAADFWHLHEGYVREAAGFPTTMFNGEIGEVPTSETVRGLAQEDGRLLFHREVWDTIENAFEHPPTTPEAIHEFRMAVKSVVHEHGHVWTQSLDDLYDSLSGLVEDPGLLAIEEGVSDAWSLDNITGLLARMRVVDVMPSVLDDTRDQSSYPDFEPAARTLAERVGGVIDTSATEVLRRWNVVGSREKLPLAAAMVLDSPGYAGLRSRLGHDERQAVTDRAAAAMLSEITHGCRAATDAIADGDLTDVVRLSRGAGAAAFDAAVTTFDALRDTYDRPPATLGTHLEDARTRAFGAVAPPTADGPAEAHPRSDPPARTGTHLRVGRARRPGRGVAL